MQILKVKLEDIGFSEVALREHKDSEEHIKDLIKDIAIRGVLNLPTLVPSAENKGKYIVTDGARRITALKALLREGKVPEVMSFPVREAQDELSTLADMVAGNSQVRKTANKQFINAIYRIATEGRQPVSVLAVKVGMSEEYIWKLFKTLKLGDEVLQAAQEKKVPISNLITLASLAKKVSDEKMDEWLDKAVDTKIADFSLEIVEELDLIRESSKGKTADSSFKLVNLFIGKNNLELLLTSCEVAFIELATPETEARFNLMKEIYQVDEKNADQRKNAWEAKLEDKKAAAADRKANRESAKLLDSVEGLEKQGFTVTAPKE